MTCIRDERKAALAPCETKAHPAQVEYAPATVDALATRAANMIMMTLSARIGNTGK
jgi:hypothetical protein